MSMSENVNVAEQMPGGGIADVDVREKVAMAANGGLMGLYNRGMLSWQFQDCNKHDRCVEVEALWEVMQAPC